MKNSTKRFPIYVAFLAVVVALTACEQEQVQYSTSETAEVSQEEAPATQPSMQMAEATTQPAVDSSPTPGALNQTIGEPPADRPRLPEGAETAEYTLQAVGYTVPAEWTATAEGDLSPMRAAEFAIPAPEGSERGAELVFYYFGPQGAGGVMDNLKRWMGQIETPAENPPVLYRSESGAFAVHEIIAHGTLLPSMMGAGLTEPVPDSMLYGVIVEGGPHGPIFLKMTGSEAAVESALPAMASLIDSLEVAAMAAPM